LKGVGPEKASLLKKELQIHTFGDLIQHYPFRYEDRTRVYSAKQVMGMCHGNDTITAVQVKGEITNLKPVGGRFKKRLIATLQDDTGSVELVWFKGIQWILKKVKVGSTYLAFGKPGIYGRKLNMAHPELEAVNKETTIKGFLQPIYPTTEKLKKKYLDSKAISAFQQQLLKIAQKHIHENLPERFLEKYKLAPKKKSLLQIHFPSGEAILEKSRFRLKFEELFFIQLRLLKLKHSRNEKFRGLLLKDTSLLNDFYNKYLPFELTSAQKRVIKEIYPDLKSGKQMNRLLQGDVGSGKTIVAFICMLIAIGSKAQVVMMAPTEILAEQHYNNLLPFVKKLKLHLAKLTGSTKASERKIIHRMLRNGDLDILVGTHALLEDVVKFKNLGLAVIDEQHRFGVAQRAKLWRKNKETYPHVLVMTATPIPRTLAMTLYGDLDVSIIDELPVGRKPIKTIHRYDAHRLRVFGFIKEQIELGRQVYIVYPLIEESEKMDFKNLMDGYESIERAFPDIPVSIVHGRMKSDAKEHEMQQFVLGKTKIMVSTTVIEVGVNVPNASVMIIENAERFGLAQLHQLRGRVGRGTDQSYCILMTKEKLSNDTRMRIKTLVQTNDGFKIADVDLKLRGPGDLSGTQQSGLLDLNIADLGKDGAILRTAREAALDVLEDDPDLCKPYNRNIYSHINRLNNSSVNWSRIS